MRAIVQTKYGPPAEVLRLGEVPRPTPGEDEVLVRVQAAAVHADIWHAVTGRPYFYRLLTGLFSPKRPVPGTDLAGVVEAVGSRVTRFKPGDAVFGSAIRNFGLYNAGAFAEYATAPEEGLALKPSNVTFAQAASVPASGYIAWSNIEGAGMGLQGKRVLVNGAGGGVGTIAVQIFKARGAHVTAVDAGPKLEMLRSLGAEETIDYTQTDFLKQATRYDLIFDVASNTTLDECRGVLNPGGLYIWIGHEHYGRAKGGSLLGQGIPRMFRIMVRGMFRDPNLPRMKFPVPKLGDGIAALRDLLANGSLTPTVETFSLEAAVDAFRRMEDASVIGKAVLTM